jgi:hypothetical protein
VSDQINVGDGHTVCGEDAVQKRTSNTGYTVSVPLAIAQCLSSQQRLTQACRGSAWLVTSANACHKDKPACLHASASQLGSDEASSRAIGAALRHHETCVVELSSTQHAYAHTAYAHARCMCTCTQHMHMPDDVMLPGAAMP